MTEFQHGVPILPKPETEAEVITRQKEIRAETYQNQQLILNRATVRLTGVLAILTLITAGASAYQAFTSKRSAEAALLAANTARDTLKELQNGSGAMDTHTLAQQAKVQSGQSAKNALAAEAAVQVANESLKVSQRAYLNLGDPEDVLGGFGIINVPVSNIGHIQATKLQLQVTYKRYGAASESNMPTLDERSTSKRLYGDVQPGPTNYGIVFVVPFLSLADRQSLGSSHESLNIGGFLTYDTGFGSRDRIAFCYMYQQIKSRWTKCGGTGDSVDFGVINGLVPNAQPGPQEPHVVGIPTKPAPQ